MLRLHVRKRRILLIVLLITLLVFGGALGAVFYYGNEAIAKQEANSAAQLAAMDKKITEIKVKKEAERKAKEEAERKAAEQKAEADKALAAQQAGQVVTPKGCAVSGAHGNPAAIDVVINKKRCFNPIDFVPPDLSSYNGFVVSAKIIPDMTAMFNAAATAGVPLGLTSAYRSYGNQVTTYNYWVTANGSTAAADTVSARPGYSEHQTGFAVDLSCGGASLDSFTGSSCYNWLIENGATYGFIQRYQPGFESTTGYNAESWHWRYVGAIIAQQMKLSNIKTLEQLWNLPGGGY